MTLAQRFERIFASPNQQIEPALNESSLAVAPVAFVLWSAVAQGQVAIERQAMFERMGPDWDERAALQSSAVQIEKGFSPLDGRPLVFGFGHWYLQRFAAIEQRIAKAVFSLNVPLQVADNRIVPDQTKYADALNLNQQHALNLALGRRLLVLTGGPGTGKTFTLVAIVNALRNRNPAIRIAACAPTGKAALRLGAQVSGLSAVATIHRLLRQPRNRFGHLDFDLVIVDEASMLDAVLADEVFQAVGPDTQLILAGDQNQLSSVRAGAVFAQLCSVATATIQLTESVRFDDQSLIGQLAAGVLKNQMDDELVNRIQWASYRKRQNEIETQANDQDQTAWFEALSSGYEPLMNALRANLVVDDRKAFELLALLKSFGALVPTHDGPVGTQASHAYLRHLIQREPTAWYHGRVIAVTQNDEATGLRNGDIGLIVNTINGLRAVFDAAQVDVRTEAQTVGVVGSGSQVSQHAGVTWLMPIALPAHDDGWVLTVHKSQGSEYKNVLLALPLVGSPQSRRELVYTAITRAKESIRLFGTVGQLSAAAKMTTERAGGLLKRLAALER
jgi:exodeoxyribonuclease V alpha subunit